MAAATTLPPLRPSGSVGGAVAFDPSLVGRGRDAPNYTVSTSTEKRPSNSSFNFVGEKRDAFEFVQDEIKRK